MTINFLLPMSQTTLAKNFKPSTNQKKMKTADHMILYLKYAQHTPEDNNEQVINGKLISKNKSYLMTR